MYVTASVCTGCSAKIKAASNAARDASISPSPERIPRVQSSDHTSVAFSA
jgi:hypothetical protein